MHRASPLGYTLSRNVGDAFRVLVTFYEVPGEPDVLDCRVQFAARQPAPAKTGLNRQNGHPGPADPPKTGIETGPGTTDPGDNLRPAQPGSGAQAAPAQEPETAHPGWFRSLWRSDPLQTGPPRKPDLSLLLGYTQLVGFVRLNHVVGADGPADSKNAVYWKDDHYASHYCGPDANQHLEEIAHTPLCAEYERSRQGPLRAWADSAARDLADPTAVDLAHDLLHAYGTALPTLSRTPVLAHLQTELAANLSKFVVPFYVTAQLLLFPTLVLMPHEPYTRRLRVPLPPVRCPPSYNTRLTGLVGEAGLSSVVYSFVVGFQEETPHGLRQRAVYFPLELVCNGHTFSLSPTVDHDWEAADCTRQDHPTPSQVTLTNTANQEADAERKAAFLHHVDMLIDGQNETVAVQLRRKSSVALKGLPGTTGGTAHKSKVLYRIKTNDVPLCVLSLLAPAYRAGDDIHFTFLLNKGPTKIVGFCCHLEAHEIYHVAPERKSVNKYKVLPTVKANVYGDALMLRFDGSPLSRVSSSIHLPRHVAQQFSAPEFMDLRYFLVFRFVLNDFDEGAAFVIDDDSKQFADYIEAYRQGNDSMDFQFSIAITVTS